MGTWIVRVLAVGLVVAAVGCGGGDGEEAGPQAAAPQATSTAAAPPCGEEAAEALTLTTADGADLDAALVGDGEVGVVLGHQLRSDF